MSLTSSTHYNVCCLHEKYKAILFFDLKTSVLSIKGMQGLWSLIERCNNSIANFLNTQTIGQDFDRIGRLP